MEEDKIISMIYDVLTEEDYSAELIYRLLKRAGYLKFTKDEKSYVWDKNKHKYYKFDMSKISKKGE